MSNIKYVIDTQGRKTGIFIDLMHPKTDNVLKDLNPAQMELLKMFASGLNPDYLDEIKQLIIDFVANKTLDRGDKIWNERGYTPDTFGKVASK